MSAFLGDPGAESSGYSSVAMSKTSSSDSATTSSTAPAQASPLEGLEHVPITQFDGIANMRKAVESQRKKLDEGSSNQQYLVLRPVTEANLAKIDGARHVLGKGLRMTFHADINLLIVKIPSTGHEVAHLQLSQKLLFKMFGMGMSESQLCPLGGSRLRGSQSSKEGDSTFKPFTRKNEHDWPTLVFESGLSESLQHLRSDARWWLENSKGDVKIVVLISIKRAVKEVRVEKWELGPSHQRVTRAHPDSDIQTPIQTREITITSDNIVTGSPLVLEFEKVFLRQPVPPEADFVFTEADLSAWANQLWQVLQ